MMGFETATETPTQPRRVPGSSAANHNEPPYASHDTQQDGRADHSSAWGHHVDDLAIRRAPRGSAASKAASSTPAYADAQAALQAAADILQNERATMIAGAPPSYAPALRELFVAVYGREADKAVDGATRVTRLDSAMRGLGPAIGMIRREDPAWIDEHITPYLSRLSADVNYIEAHDRVANSLRVGAKQVIELPDDDHPHEQGAVLHDAVSKLLSTMGTVNEQVLRGNHSAIDHEAEAAFGHGHDSKLGPGSLVHLQNVLFLANGWLTLTDEELRQHLAEVHSVFPAVTNYLELVKAVTALTAGALGTTAAYAAAVAKLAGDEALYASATGFAKLSGLKFANVIAAIEAVRAGFVISDPAATSQQKIDAGADLVSNGVWLVTRNAPGAAASSIIMLTYGEAKLALTLYWEAALGISAGLMKEALGTLVRDGNDIARAMDELIKAGLLLDGERDPEKRSALTRVQSNLAADLGQDVDELVDDCEPHGIGSYFVKYPGNWEILREAFAPVVSKRGARSVPDAMGAARLALERLAWVLSHAGELVIASTRNRHLKDVEEADKNHRDEAPTP